MEDLKITKPSKNIFLVSRTSMCCSDKKPCEEAYPINIIDVDTRTVDDPKKIPCYFNGREQMWYREGTNHRVENGKIKRDMGITQEWAIETDDILSFIDKCDDPVIISKNDDGYYRIEIYDDWRE